MVIDIINILESSRFTDKFIDFVHETFPKKYKFKFKNPYNLPYLDNPMMGLRPEERLYESLAQLIPLRKYYVDKGIPLSYLYASIYDLNYRVERYYNEHGIYGLSEWDLRWLTSMYRARIFDIGSLRFEVSLFSNKEIERSGYQYMHLEQKWKTLFPEGTPIITIHILKDADLSPHKVEKSFTMAKDFFDKYFKKHNYKIFICRTWMLYGPTRDILGKNSNISSFGQRFKIIAHNENKKQALDRIYGTSDMSTIKKIDKQTSLEKVAYKNLDKLGVAAGIIYKNSI